MTRRCIVVTDYTFPDPALETALVEQGPHSTELASVSPTVVTTIRT